jgi:hypothetical protein
MQQRYKFTSVLRKYANPSEQWTYIKYNLVFDWSGMAAEISWLSRVGAFLRGGQVNRWHRLDIHMAAIMAFDRAQRLRLLTLAQHNHQQTFCNNWSRLSKTVTPCTAPIGRKW